MFASSRECDAHLRASSTCNATHLRFFINVYVLIYMKLENLVCASCMTLVSF